MHLFSSLFSSPGLCFLSPLRNGKRAEVPSSLERIKKKTPRFPRLFPYALSSPLLNSSPTRSSLLEPWKLSSCQSRSWSLLNICACTWRALDYIVSSFMNVFRLIAFWLRTFEFYITIKRFRKFSYSNSRYSLLDRGFLCKFTFRRIGYTRAKDCTSIIESR